MCTPPPLSPPLPPLSEVLERTYVVSLPMRVRFRGITVREAALFSGPQGWGEFSPFLEYGAPEAAAWLASGLEAAWSGLPAPRRASIPLNGTIPAVPPDEVAAIAARFPGVHTFKIKVAEAGQSLADDAARVAALRAARPDATIRVDANRGWTVPQAVAAARALGELEYLEQPCADVPELKLLRRELDAAGLDTPIAADESIRKASDPYRVARERAAEAAVLKVAPLGGVRRMGEIAQHLWGCGIRVTVASALDTAVGMNAGLVAAANLPGEGDPPAAGLGTQQLFEADVAAAREMRDGRLATRPVAPEPERLAELAAPGRRRDWWMRRIAACYGVLRSGGVQD